jgi:hypothetical protein
VSAAVLAKIADFEDGLRGAESAGDLLDVALSLVAYARGLAAARDEVWVVTYSWDDYDGDRDRFVGVGATAEAASAMAEADLRKQFKHDQDEVMREARVVTAPSGCDPRARDLVYGGHTWRVTPEAVR